MDAEITNISPNGFWILIDQNEHFVPFDDFPWFADKTIRQISNVSVVGFGHLYWEDLDIDLTVDMIEHPDRYPLAVKTA